MDQQKLSDLFLQLVKIDGVSLKERHMADFIKHKLHALKINVREDDAAAKLNGNSGNLIARIPSKDMDLPPLMLLAHMDTVRSTAEVKPVLENGIIRSDGNTILGADNRAGVALILYVIEEIVGKKRKHRTLEIVFTVAEELGMLGALELDFSALSAKEGLVFDCSAIPGGYVAETPTAIDFKVKCQGKAAHSAVAPEKGINALSMALQVMNQFPVGRIHEKTVANIGTIHGGSADNVVPDQVMFTGEFRSFSASEIERMRKGLESNCQAAGHKIGGQCDVSFITSFHGFRFDPQMPLVSRLHKMMQQLDLKPNPMIYYGGSDANVLNVRGIQVINMGIGASNPHSNEERIALTDIAKGADIVMRMINTEPV